MPVCYLIHFSRKLHHAGHYIGFTNNLPRRMNEHLTNSPTGAKLLRALNPLGIEWEVVRVWDAPEWSNGGHALELALKRRKKASDFCPVCRGEEVMREERRTRAKAA